MNRLSSAILLAFALSLLSIWMFLANKSSTEEISTYNLVIKNHQFYPAELFVQAGKKIKLIVENQDDTIEEFESIELNRERLIPAHQTIQVLIAPLTPGKYSFFGDFHQDTAQGFLIAD